MVVTHFHGLRRRETSVQATSCRRGGLARHPPAGRRRGTAGSRPALPRPGRPRARRRRLRRRSRGCRNRLYAFRRQVLGEQDVVVVELYVPIRHALDLDLRDRRAVDERTSRDQHLAADVDADRVARRDGEIAGRSARPERVRGDADRQRGLRPRVATEVERAVPEPADRPQRARTRHREVADGKVLDGDVAARRADARAGSVADGDGLVGELQRLDVGERVDGAGRGVRDGDRRVRAAR